jgi:hypothetical protein
MTFRKLTLAAAVAMAMSAPATVVADSELSFGTSASADLNFRVTLPQFIYFQVGDPTDGTVDTIDFDLSGGPEPGGGTVAGSATVPVNLVTNISSGSVQISATGADLTGTGGNTDTIPVTDISGTGTGTIPVPTTNGSAAAVGAAPFAGTDNWTFTYSNPTPVAAPISADVYTTTVTYTVQVL